MQIKNSLLNTSFPLGTYLGIPLKLHWSIILVTIMIFSIGQKENFGLLEYFVLTLVFVALFISVTLHEYGHAWMASNFNIKTKDIILSPIGGVARLVYMPKNPWQEFKIALAGPMVNIIIFALIGLPLGGLLIAGYVDYDIMFQNFTRLDSFFAIVATMNLLLFLFNLLPAFPMDGGRILRSLLSMKMDHLKATVIASRIGKTLSVIGAILGFYTGNYTWIAIATFIFFMADIETSFLRKEKKLNETKAIDLAKKELTKVYLHTPIQKVIESYFEVGEKYFLVQNNLGRIVGVLTQDAIQDALRTKDTDALVSSYVTHRFGIVNEHDGIQHVIQYMKTQGFPISLVKNFGEVLGVLTVQDLNSWILKSNQMNQSSWFNNLKADLNIRK